MKKILLALVMVGLVCGVAQAQCVPEIKAMVMDEFRGSMIVKTEYVLNGMVVDENANPCWLDEVSGKYLITYIHPKTGQSYNQECMGEVRYSEINPITGEKWIDSDLTVQAKLDVDIHRDNLIRRTTENREFIRTERLKIQKALTQPIIDKVKANLIGYTSSSSEVTDTFKGKDIKVTYDQKNTVTDTILAVE